MRKELAKSYQPKDFEDRIYAQWMEKAASMQKSIRKKNRIPL
jgi:hypothetical protein